MGKYLYDFRIGKLFLKTYYFEIILTLPENLKYSTKNSRIPFTHVPQTFTFGNTCLSFREEFPEKKQVIKEKIIRLH